MAKGKTAADRKAAESSNERRSERVAHWQDGWATGMVEGMASAASLALQCGELDSARKIYDEILRRFDARCGCRAFLDLDAALNEALDEGRPKVNDPDGL